MLTSLRKFIQYIRAYGLRTTLQKVLSLLKKRISAAVLIYKVTADNRNNNTITSMSAMVRAYEAMNASIVLRDKIMQIDTNECILILSHELNLTGAPVAIEHMAEVFLSMGKKVIVLSPHDGILRTHFTNMGIPTIVFERVYYSDLVKRSAGLFEMIVVSTIVGAPMIKRLNGNSVPVMWWIHEARASYTKTALATMPKYLEENIHVFCGGAYAQRILKEYRPEYKTDVLLYYVPDRTSLDGIHGDLDLSATHGKTVFAMVGMLEQRKGQDILAKAIRLLPEDKRNKCYFFFVGKQYYPPQYSNIENLCSDYPEHIQYIEQLEKDELECLYRRMDCLVCASLDDPMPVVVSDAMALSKLIICSENTGSAELLKNGGGLVYYNNSPEQLAQCIIKVLDDPQTLNPMRIKARELFETCFSKEIFYENIKNIYRDIKLQGLMLPETKISVVIPTYNAGKEFANMIEKLTLQEGLTGLELIIVDSGSTDETVTVAKKYGAKVLHIPQEQFSHSYSRNIGAEHATGQYVLFMTQDAIPADSFWVISMAQPILRNQAVAVSCREQPRNDCDLFGAFSIWCHSNYMDIMETDRIMKMPSSTSADELRRNAQLNDVACMVRKDAFSRFGYRGDYAEDLDLGIRLIEAGYQLAILSKTPVIHSHTRPGFYYMKRCLVDVTTLKKIIPTLPTETINEAECMNRLILGYAAVKMYLKALSETYQTADSLKSFAQWSQKTFDMLAKRLDKASYTELNQYISMETSVEDKELYSFVLGLYKQSENTFYASMESVFSAKFFVVKQIVEYLNNIGLTADSHTKELIADSLMKWYGQKVGITLANYADTHDQDNSYLNGQIMELKKGI